MAGTTLSFEKSKDKSEISLTKEQREAVTSEVDACLLPLHGLASILAATGTNQIIGADVADTLKHTLDSVERSIREALETEAVAPEMPDHAKLGESLERPAEAVVELLFHRELYDKCRSLFEQGELQQICDLLNKRQEASA